MLNISFDNFSIRLLGYRIEFSCLYIPQGHNFISTLWLCSTDEYVFFFENPPLYIKMTTSVRFFLVHNDPFSHGLHDASSFISNMCYIKIFIMFKLN